ncbi:MAG: AAA family ATPase [archaeon]
MRIKKIRLENIRSYKFQEIEFPEGSVLLWGNIGSGKSSVLLGIDFALFGLQKGNLTGSSLLRNGEERGSVELFFEVDGKDYVIKRGLKKSKTGVTQDFGFIVFDGVREEKTALELKQKVLEILNYPKNLLTKNKALIFRYTVYTPQEEMKLILLGGKEERLDALRKVFGIDKYKRIKENAKIVIADIKSKKKVKEGFISDLETKIVERMNKDGELKKEETKINEIQILFEEINKKVTEKKEEIKLIEDKKELLNKLKKDLEINRLNFEHKRKSIEENKLKISSFLEEKSPEICVFDDVLVNGLKKEISEVETVLRGALDKMQELKTKRLMAEELKNKVSSINNCPTCLQAVEETHKKNITEAEDRRIKAIDAAFVNITIKKEGNEKNLSELREKLEVEKKKEGEYKLQRLKFEQFKEKEKEIIGLKEKNDFLITEITQLEENNKEIELKISELNFVDNIYSKIKEEFERWDKEFRQKELEKRESNTKIMMIKKNIIELEQEIKYKEESRKKLEHLSKIQLWMENHFVNLVENMEKSVMFKVHEDFNSLFEKWFDLLVGNESLNMTLDEEFSPRIFQNDYDTDYAFLSGGERTAGALAYRLALNQVINQLMSSIKTNNLLILDEPTDGFSSEQLDKMKNLMEEMAANQVIIVSHDSKVESFVDNIIRFEKIDHVTNVVA